MSVAARLPIPFLLSAFLACTLALMDAAPAIAQAGIVKSAANKTGTSLSLEQRRQLRRDKAIRSSITQCRNYANRLSTLKGTPCSEDDVLDARRNLCLPRKGRYPAYLRWDPAAGRCRPRDKYEQGSCDGPKGRYIPGRRHAQSAVGSFRMYGAATQRAEATLERCTRGLGKLRNAAAKRHQASARDCAISKRLRRRDLIALYCK
jgi:hypothetical protein